MEEIFMIFYFSWKFLVIGKKRDLTVRYDTWNVHEGCIETHHREPTRDGQDQERRALEKAYIEHSSKNSTYALWTNVATSAFLLGDIRCSR